MIEEAEDAASSAFAISQEDIDYVLQHGSGFENGKHRICDYYKGNHSVNETAAFLKKEYGIGGWSQPFSDGGNGFTDHDAKGLTITKYGDPRAVVWLPWLKAVRRIGELIAMDRYLTGRDGERPAPVTAPALTEILQDIEVTEDGDTVTISVPNTDDNTKYVEMDVTLPDEPEPPMFFHEENGEDLTSKQIDVVPAVQRLNFSIADDHLGEGGAKTKFAWNVEAIRLLNKIEKENRLATADEQLVLSRYVGWGGLPQAFDANNTQWENEYGELKALLSEVEYVSARSSTLNAHYTSPVVIKAIYTCLENMKFRKGNILEPACGVGNFFGLIPESMSGSKLYGIELDSITGRLAQQLYQDANIAIQGYEETNLPDSFFDVAIGNVPFGSYGVADKKYEKNHFYIHDYFFAKSLDKVRPSGMIIFITSKGTLDKRNPEVRKYIAQRAELLGAVRLPNNAFLANAGTEVTSDIVILQKRDRIIDVEPEWVHLGETESGIPINSYFAEHPEMMLGTMTHSDRMYGNENDTTCLPFEGADLAEQLHQAINNIHAEISEYEIEDQEDSPQDTIVFPKPVNWVFWIVAEIGAMATDLAEFLGGTLGLNLLFHIPMLYAGLLTGLMTYIICYMEKYGQKIVEVIITVLVTVISGAYLIEIFLSKPDWTQVGIHTIVPSLPNGEAVMIAVGMLGATVMPHVIYLHSQLVQCRCKDMSDEGKRNHLKMEKIDIAIAMNIAFFVNAATLVVSAAVFYRNGMEVDTMQQAHKSLEPLLGSLSSGAFGIALLASGLSSSAVGTMAGQTIMKGFVNISIPINVRRLVTMLPALIIIGLGINPMKALVLSQVALSFILPVPIIQMLYISRRKKVMGNFANKIWVQILGNL